MGNALMGVMPHDVLGRTGLIRPYPTSDLVLLAELALLGPFHEIAAPLFERRIHEGSATKGARSVDELDVWFSTSAGRSPALPPMVRFLIGTDRALLALYRGLFFFGLCRLIAWTLWARVLADPGLVGPLDLSVEGPWWIEARSLRPVPVWLVLPVSPVRPPPRHGMVVQAR